QVFHCQGSVPLRFCVVSQQSKDLRIIAIFERLEEGVAHPFVIVERIALKKRRPLSQRCSFARILDGPRSYEEQRREFAEAVLLRVRGFESRSHGVVAGFKFERLLEANDRPLAVTQLYEIISFRRTKSSLFSHCFCECAPLTRRTGGLLPRAGLLKTRLSL